MTSAAGSALESLAADAAARHGRPSGPGTGRKGHIGLVVAGSLATGLVAALLLFAAPFVPATESGVTGAVLCGFALGWAMLAVLSVRLTDQPQSWAAVPALVMGAGGVLLEAFGSAVRRAGGQLVASGRIPTQALLAAIEADELEELADEGTEQLAAKEGEV